MAGEAAMKSLIDRAGWILAGVLALGVIAFAAREVAGGPLDPPGAPTSTMQTLDNIPGAWDRRLDSTNGLGNGCESSRFKCTLLNEGVLDLETGLVWAREANAAAGSDEFSWIEAYSKCVGYRGGGRTGWRLPTISELMSLLDQTQTNPNASLPLGHPFLEVLDGSHTFWTATEDKDNPATNAYVVDFLGVQAGFSGVFGSYVKDSSQLGAWCMRGANTQ
jgi:hypothetical protein